MFSNLHVTSADYENTQVLDTTLNGTDAHQISSAVFLYHSVPSSVSASEFIPEPGLKHRINSFELDYTRIFLAGELVAWYCTITEISGPWFLSYKLEEVFIHPALGSFALMKLSVSTLQVKLLGAVQN